MQKKILILSVLLVFANPAAAYKVTTFQPLQPMQPLSSYNSASSGFESYPKITQVEAFLFKRGYEGENIYTRLDRIEQRIFRRRFPDMPLAGRVENILANIDEGLMYGISLRELAQMETRIFGQTFPREDTDTRISRLEKEMLGAMQQGNLKQRYNTIKTAAKHYNAFPQQYAAENMPSTYGGQKPNLLTKLLDGLAAGFGAGAMTGFTPSVYDQYDQFASYPQYIPGNGAGMQDYYAGNRGGYLNNRSIGSGAGVKVFY
jgi:hypothetical protein